MITFVMNFQAMAINSSVKDASLIHHKLSDRINMDASSIVHQVILTNDNICIDLFFKCWVSIHF
jgi:hypothetical protein